MPNPTRAEWEKTSIITLDSRYNNCTKCNACGSWVTDKTKPDYIAGLCVCEYVDGKTYCSQCAMFAREDN